MRYTTRKAKNLRMDDGVYKLRREVMGYIYEAKEVVELPRITVRVTENHKTMLGCAKISGNVLWITERAITEWDLRPIVYHEIGHAVFGAEHDEKCPLMKATQNQKEKVTKRQCQEALVKMGVAK